MYDIDRKSCTACRKVGALHCSDPTNCGQMKDEADNWMSWLDDLPVHAEFDEGIGRLQEYISALRAALDAAEARERQAVEAERDRCIEALRDQMMTSDPVVLQAHVDAFLSEINTGDSPATFELYAAAIRTGAKP